MKVLVTGSAGLLARETLPALERAGHDVLGLDIADADVTQYDALMHPVGVFRPDWILHLAAFTQVDDCETEVDKAFLVNGLGARNAALAAAACGAAILAVSTDYVFDGTGHVPYREYDPTGPRSVYGASKWAGEQSVRELHPRHIVVRSGWLYGRGGRNFVDTILRRARAGEPLAVVDDQRGAPTWTYDLSEALVRLMEKGVCGTYHVSNGGVCTWHEVASYVIARAGLKMEPGRTTTQALGRPAPRPAYSVLNNQLYEHVTGARMPHWQDAVDRYLKAQDERSQE